MFYGRNWIDSPRLGADTILAKEWLKCKKRYYIFHFMDIFFINKIKLQYFCKMKDKSCKIKLLFLYC